MDNAVDSYLRLPPMSRNIATCAFLISLGVIARAIPSSYLMYQTSLVLRMPPQIWRLATCFLVTGPKLNLLFDTYFLYTYLSQMEVGNSRFPRKEDLIWYLVFVCGTILVANHFSGYGFPMLLPALILALSYTVTQDQRGAKVNYMFITIPAQLVPYAMLVINLIFPGGIYGMILQLHGLFAAHLFNFLSRTWPEYGGGRNLIPTPAILSRIVQRTGAPSAGRSLGGSGAATSSGPLPDSWRTRGPGQRLG